MLVVVGVIYGTTYAIGEFCYIHAFREPDSIVKRVFAQEARFFFPLERRYREADAFVTSVLANVQPDNANAKKEAINSIVRALKDDPAAADLMAYLISFRLQLNQDEQAKVDFERFKKIAHVSDLSKLTTLRPHAD